MKSLLFILGLLSLNLGLYADQSGKLSPFNALEVRDAIEVEVRKGKQKVVFEGETKVVSKIKTTVEDGVLLLHMDEDVRKKNKVKVIITIPNITAVSIHSASSVTFVDMFDANEFNLELSSASRAKVKVNCRGSLRVHCSGASRLNLSGIATSVDADLSGASVLKAGGMKVGNMNLNASGASIADVNVEDELLVEASGASKIRHGENTRTINSNISGAASVESR